MIGRHRRRWPWASASTWARSCRSSRRGTCCWRCPFGLDLVAERRPARRRPGHRPPDRRELRGPQGGRGAPERRDPREDRARWWRWRSSASRCPPRHGPDLAGAAARRETCSPPSGVAMIAVLWSFDGWYAVTNLAGEMRRPERDLPLGLIVGTARGDAALRAHEPRLRARAQRGGDEATSRGSARRRPRPSSGPSAARLISAAVLVSTFGCISATILYAARIYLPMAQDGVFFPALARIHPRYRTPSASILAQGVWAIAAHVLRELRAALHLRDVRGGALPRGHGRRGLRAAADASRRAAALSRLGLPVGAPGLHPLLGRPGRSTPSSRSRGNRPWASGCCCWASRPTFCGGGARPPPRGGPIAARDGLALRGSAAAVGMLVSREIAVLDQRHRLQLPALPVPAAARAGRRSPSSSPSAPGGTRALPAPSGADPVRAPGPRRSPCRGLREAARGLEVFSLLLIVWGSSGIFMPGGDGPQPGLGRPSEPVASW